MALKTKDDNLSDDKSSLPRNLRYWYSLYFQPNHWAILSRTFSFIQLANRFELYDQYVIDFDIDFKSH